MQFISEADEMFTRISILYGKSLMSVLKPKKEKEFMKHINQDKPKKVQSYITEAKPNNLPNLDNIDLDEAIKIKRDASQLPETYQPKFVEQFWYKYWDQKKYFHPKAEDVVNDKKYVMVLPPPNVTGYLHLGHGLTSAVEDSLVRIHRMRGFVTCYLPGTDHAGIATQSVVEKSLAKQGISKWDLGREKFLEKVWEWKEKHGTQILEQLKRAGSSLDWDRFHFTMDPQLQKAVTEAFIRLADKGLIYRANRLVNWSCRLRTAISDIEVAYEDIDKPRKFSVPGHKGEYEFGWMTYFTYKVQGTGEKVTIATTRLETMLGDVAVAVNSQDERYKHLHGKFLEHPFIAGRLLKIIVDDELVDMTFGTGAVKVTPAHDPRDYECGNKHGLEFITIFDEEGKINEQGGVYQGMMRFDCRIKMEEDMKKLGILVDKKPNQMRLGFCQRSGDVIEPMIKPQWYVSCQGIKGRMIEVVENGELQLIPGEYKQDWNRWMEGLRDWCISRQIWWGHRVPAYIVTVNGKKGDRNKQDDWVFARNIEEAYEKAVEKFKVGKDQISIEQDEDVLDTWFSSGLFPFSTFGWPDVEHPDFSAFFPNTILETGWDILFFWVARMVQFSLLFFDKVPFKYVFLHPIIRDKDGKKMSKSLGNVIDPLEIIEGTTLQNLKQKVLDGNLPPAEQQRTLAQKEAEFPTGIPECGADALRYGLLAYMQKTANINLDVLHIIGYRQFCNKIWQTCRFALPKIPVNIQYPKLQLQDLELVNAWIIVRLNVAIQTVNKNFDDYEFGQATQAFHNFWQYELCDVYLEGIKNILSDKNKDEKLKLQTQQTLLTCLDLGFRLLHPMMPFLSEELWQKLPNFPGKEDALCIAQYPVYNPEWQSAEVQDKFDSIQQIARGLRQIISDAKLPPSARPETFVQVLNDDGLSQLVKQQQDVLTLLARTKSVQLINQEGEEQKLCGKGTVGAKLKLYVALKDNIDIDKELERLNKKAGELTKFIKQLEEKISKYSEKVPEAVRKQDNDKLVKYIQEQQLLEQQFANINKMKQAQ